MQNPVPIETKPTVTENVTIDKSTEPAVKLDQILGNPATMNAGVPTVPLVPSRSKKSATVPTVQTVPTDPNFTNPIQLVQTPKGYVEVYPTLPRVSPVAQNPQIVYPAQGGVQVSIAPARIVEQEPIFKTQESDLLGSPLIRSVNEPVPPTTLKPSPVVTLPQTAPSLQGEILDFSQQNLPIPQARSDVKTAPVTMQVMTTQQMVEKTEWKPVRTEKTEWQPVYTEKAEWEPVYTEKNKWTNESEKLEFSHSGDRYNIPLLKKYLETIANVLEDQQRALMKNKGIPSEKMNNWLKEDCIVRQRLYFLLGCAFKREVDILRNEATKTGQETQFPQYCLTRAFSAVCFMNKKYPRLVNGKKKSVNEMIPIYNELCTKLKGLFRCGNLAGQFALAYVCGLDFSLTKDQFVKLSGSIHNPRRFHYELNACKTDKNGFGLNPWISKQKFEKLLDLLDPKFLNVVLSKLFILDDEEDSTPTEKWRETVNDMRLPTMRIPESLLNKN